MKKESERTINQLKAMYKEEAPKGNDAKKINDTRFIRCKQGVELYNMSRNTFVKIAVEAGAAYKINATILVDRYAFERYLENYRIPAGVL